MFLGHWWVLLIIGAIALIIFGPQRLPEVGAGLGKALREFRKGASEMTDSLKEEATKPLDAGSAAGTTYPPAESPTATAGEPPHPPTPPATPPPEARETPQG
jgi:TatA/E family protein of Tat protein translocase